MLESNSVATQHDSRGSDLRNYSGPQATGKG
jgi:hypothetical protein